MSSEEKTRLFYYLSPSFALKCWGKEIICCFSSLSGARDAIDRERIVCPLLM
jgi:hypothetical protein